MPAPIWLLDVDGVINASRAGWGSPPNRRHAISQGRQYALKYSAELVKAIRTVHNEGLAEVRWCTTWCPDADQLERLWGFPPLIRMWDEYPSSGYVDDLKRSAARDVLAQGRRLIWTDDEVTPLPDSSPQLYAELTNIGRALLIRPNSGRGLRPNDITEIINFCKEG